MLKFIFSKVFFVNLFIAIIIVSIGLYIFLNFFDDFTDHGESITVPDLRKMQCDEAVQFLSDKDLRLKIMDSTYKPQYAPHSILEQDPPPDTKVKPNRRIYVTINTLSAPRLKMPELRDMTLRQAKSIIESKGLKLGDIKYRPDLAKNVVLKQLYKEKEIKPGTMIFNGSTIDLILGDGLGTTKVSVPNLTGLKIEEAKNLLNEYFLNVGAIIYKSPISDTSKASVFDQIPAYKEGVMLMQGQSVDIFVQEAVSQEVKNP